MEMAPAVAATLLAASLAPRIAQELDRHPLVMVGELHRWAELHAFLRDLVRDPAFICRVDSWWSSSATRGCRRLPTPGAPARK